MRRSVESVPARGAAFKKPSLALQPQGKVSSGPKLLSPRARSSAAAAAAASFAFTAPAAFPHQEVKERVNRRAGSMVAQTVKSAQAQARANPDYFNVVQRGKFSPELRKAIITWMQRCAAHFQLLPETLDLSVYLFDRFMSLVHIPGDKHVRVIGVACVFLATKLSEAMEDGPPVRDLVVASGAAFSVNDIMRMERIILSKLTWTVGAVVTNTHVAEVVLDAFLRAEDGGALTPEQHRAMQQSVHRTLHDAQTDPWFLRFDPTQVAGAACVVAALQVNHHADVKQVYTSVCAITNTDTAVVAECAAALERFVQPEMPMF